MTGGAFLERKRVPDLVGEGCSAHTGQGQIDLVWLRQREMLEVMPLSQPRSDLCLGLNLAHGPENLGIVGLKRPSQIRWPNTPCACGK